MIDFGGFKEINTKAIDSIKKDSDNDKITGFFQSLIFYFLFYLLPLLSVFTVFYYCLKITPIETTIATVIAIFTGLFFSLLLDISSRIRIEKGNVNVDNDNFLRYKNNMKQIANITIYTISLGIYVFAFLILNHLLKNDCYPYIEISLTAIIFFLIVRFLISILFIIQRFRFIIRDEIENVL